MFGKTKKSVVMMTVLCLLACLLLQPAAVAVDTTQTLTTSKIAPEVTQAFADGAQTVKVYVWMTDIDQNQVDVIVEQKTGLRADSLAVIEENISTELATRIVSEANNDQLSAETESMLQAYLDRTATQRTQERQRTDLYTATRRAEAKTKYNEKSAAFITQSSLNKENVIFASSYAPMLILELTQQEVNALAARADVENVSIYVEELLYDNEVTETIQEPDLAGELVNCGIARIKQVSGLSGNGVKIGNAENYAVNTDDENIINHFGNRIFKIGGQSSEYLEHSTKVCLISGSDIGIANSAQIYTVGFTQTTYESENGIGYFAKIEDLVDYNVDVINMSNGSSFDATPTYSVKCQWIDHIVSTHGISFVKSAGNNGNTSDGYINEPGLAENIITVGSYHEVKNDDGTYYNQLANYSSYNNGNGICKPDVVGLGSMYLDENGNGGGTSFSTPFVTGIVALLLELRPSLAAYPHVVKAIILASCHEKALLSSGDADAVMSGTSLSDKQGAGIVNPYIAIAIASHGTYGFGVLPHLVSSADIKMRQPVNTAKGMNVSLTWMREIIPASDHTTGTITTVGTHHELNLQLLNSGVVLGTSSVPYSSIEMLYTTLNADNDDLYTIRINRAIPNTGTVRYAYAWSVEDIRFQFSNNLEGIGYLKNANSSAYLQTDESTLAVSQNVSFDGDFDQMWIIQKVQESDLYHLLSAFSSIGGTTINNDLNAVITASNAASVSVITNTDGTLSFCCIIDDTLYYLDVVNSSTTSGAQVAWIPNSGAVLSSQKWYFEPCAYERGDVNRNGTVDTEDARYIMRAAVGLETPNTLQAFLCDITCDGIIGTDDSRTAQRYAVNMDPDL